MRHAIRSMTGGSHQSSARVVDGKLILSFPQALTPIVWQMDLNQAKSSALEVHENKNTGVAVLTLKTAGGGTTEIAPFEKRAQAVDALMAVSRALENAQGQIRPFSSAGTEKNTSDFSARPRNARSGGKWAAIALGVVLFFVLLNIWGAMLPRSPSGFEGTAIAPASGDAPSSPGENGVPLSADDILNSQ